MSTRVSKNPINIPSGVEIKLNNRVVDVKGAKGALSFELPRGINIDEKEGVLTVVMQEMHDQTYALAGTTRAILNNLVKGVTEGFSKKLQLVGVGYRAQSSKVNNRSKLDLTLGLSHPVTYVAPEGIELLTPSVTEIEVQGIDKQLVGQVAADIRGICGGVRKPEPYKGKGIRYADERIIIKETKKK